MAGRPDESDFAVAREFAERTCRRFAGEDEGILGEVEKTTYTEDELDQIEAFRFGILTTLPTRNGEDCSMCMCWEERCPAGAIDVERGEADKDKCIACLGFVTACPEGALHINDTSGTWAGKLAMEGADEEEMKQKQSRIYF